MPAYIGYGHLFTKEFRERNRNRYIVYPFGGTWNVLRVGHKGGVALVLPCKSEHRARNEAARLNHLFVEGEVI